MVNLSERGVNLSIGFSLEDVVNCLESGNAQLTASLVRQPHVVREKIVQSFLYLQLDCYFLFVVLGRLTFVVGVLRNCLFDVFGWSVKLKQN